MTIHETRESSTIHLECVQDGLSQGHLLIRQLEPKLWQVQEWKAPEHSAECMSEIIRALRALGLAEQAQFLSNNLNTPVNNLLEQAGWHVAKQKALVERSLLQPLPEVHVAFQWRSLEEVGSAEFIRVLLSASQGDPFQTSTPQTAEQDFAALVEYAGTRFDPSRWFIAAQDGQEVGVVLPQVYADRSDTGTLFYLGVCPEFRGRGLGRALHAEGLKQLQARGAANYQGSTDLRNEGMRRIFALNGCTEVRQQWFYEGAGT